jgi:CheY-like chemotaxis protein
MRFLLVEDDEDHAHLVSHHLQRCDQRNQVECVRDGHSALAYLRGEGEFARALRPDLILLDLKLPKLDGHEVLAAIKQDPALRSIPVVVLTTSGAQADRSRAYHSHANSYLVKPLDCQQFRQLLEALCRYWRDWNQPCRDAD